MPPALQELVHDVQGWAMIDGMCAAAQTPAYNYTGCHFTDIRGFVLATCHFRTVRSICKSGKLLDRRKREIR